MAEEKQSKQSQGASQGKQQESQMYTGPRMRRDAAHTVTQPTSYKLTAAQQTIGTVPDDRFTEEVVKGSDEDSGSGWDSHPEENQPVKGISEGDELPDTTGRAALKSQKK